MELPRVRRSLEPLGGDRKGGPDCCVALHRPPRVSWLKRKETENCDGQTELSVGREHPIHSAN